MDNRPPGIYVSTSALPGQAVLIQHVFSDHNVALMAISADDAADLQAKLRALQPDGAARLPSIDDAMAAIETLRSMPQAPIAQIMEVWMKANILGQSTMWKGKMLTDPEGAFLMGVLTVMEQYGIPIGATAPAPGIKG